MRLVSFAAVSFLAATVSAGFSANLGNADYSAHRLEKRALGEDRQKQLEEEIEQGQEHYNVNRDRYHDIKEREKRLEGELFQASMEGLSVTRDQCKAESNGIYDRLMVPGPDNEILQGQYTKANEDIDKVKEDIWVNTLVCEHMTEVYTKLFAS
ncbi:hypothetical protein BASA83_002332 [Batrachochytrium salamandrivorans]|nr:hypothetical protein BASA83_002332 [Batrachochytrium salamandrivorans]